MAIQTTPEGLANARKNLKPKTFVHGESRRQMLIDAIELEQLVMAACRKKRNNALALSSLVTVFCRIIPLIRALQNKTLMLQGSVNRRLDADPVKLLKQARKHGLRSIVDVPTLYETPQGEAQATTTEQKPKEST